jgi:hypothetical protein
MRHPAASRTKLAVRTTASVISGFPRAAAVLTSLEAERSFVYYLFAPIGYRGKIVKRDAASK